MPTSVYGECRVWVCIHVPGLIGEFLQNRDFKCVRGVSSLARSEFGRSLDETEVESEEVHYQPSFTWRKGKMCCWDRLHLSK